MSRREKLIARIRARPPACEFTDVQRLLEDFGWKLARQRGSHAMFVRPNARTFTIPVHGGKVKRTYVNQICELLELDE